MSKYSISTSQRHLMEVYCLFHETTHYTIDEQVECLKDIHIIKKKER